MRTQLPSALLAIALACSLFAAPAQAAGAPRTFLSAAGSDANNCTNVATPCRHLAAAFAATAADGEIYVLDPANYGSLTITHAVSIEGHGWASIAPQSNGNAITINAGPSDKINIIGVVLDGTALAGTNGIVFNSGNSLTVRDSIIRNFSGNGILLQSVSSTTFLIANTIVSDNSMGGIVYTYNGFFGVQGAMYAVNGVIDHVEATNNGTGISFQIVFAEMIGVVIINAAISNTVSSNNAGDGLFISTSLVNRFIVNINSSSINNNGSNGINDVGSADMPIILLGRSVISGNGGNGIICNGAGTVATYSDNRINWNQHDLSCTLNTTSDILR